MKEFNKLTEKELFNLDYDTVEKYIKLECAKQGIKLFKKPSQPKLHTIPEGNQTVYITGMLGEKIVFEEMEDAKEMIDFLKKSKIKAISKNYDFNLEIRKEFLTPVIKDGYGMEMFDIVSRKVFTDELYKHVEQILKENKEIQSKYDNEFQNYRNFISDTEELKNNIWKKVNLAKTKFNQLNDWCKIFKDDYIPLSENKEDVAMKFMVKAYSLGADAQAYILRNYKSKK